MEEKNLCPVHGERNANDCHNYSGRKAVEHPEMRVDPDCTCDVGKTGPAMDNNNITTGPASDRPVGPGK